MGGDVITLTTSDDETARRQLIEELRVEPNVEDGTVRFEVANGAQALAQVFRTLTPEILSVDLHKPSLEDVFIQLTGRTIRDAEASEGEKLRSQMRTGGTFGPMRPRRP